MSKMGRPLLYSEPLVRSEARIPESTRDRLDTLARRRGVSLNVVIVDILRAHLAALPDAQPSGPRKPPPSS